MIFAIGLPPAFLTAICASRIARVCTFTKSGIIRPRRTPRRPSIGFCSCSERIVASSSRSSALAASPAFVTLTSCSSRLGRNSWSGGSIEPDDDRQAIHRAEDALEVALLEHLELGHRGVEAGDDLLLVGVERLAGRPLRLRAGRHARDEDRAADDLEPLALAEHVLGPAEADALGAVAACLGGLFGLVRVRPHAEAADLVGPAEDPLEVGLLLVSGRHGRERAGEDVAGRAIEADPVALLEGGAGLRAPRGPRGRSPRRAPRSPRRRACRSGVRRPRRATWRRREP